MMNEGVFQSMLRTGANQSWLKQRIKSVACVSVCNGNKKIG